MSVSKRERTAHVIRRLSMGVHPDLLAVLPDTDAAVGAALDLSALPAPPLAMAAPPDYDSASRVSAIGEPIAWWIERMRSPDRLVEERLVWFWHDHFATSIAKVRVPYLMWRQHLTLRAHATGNFADLLRAIARDPAMLMYLDGISNATPEINENFGRECMELFAMGRDAGYAEDDVVAASRAFSGWVVNVPGRLSGRVLRSEPWSATFVAPRHDAGVKTLLGVTGALDMDGALDVILDHPSTARHVVKKLHRELVGSAPDDATLDRLAKGFRKDYAIMGLVEAIASERAFTADEAVRVKYRSPLEKLVGILQASGAAGVDFDATRRRSAARRVGIATGARVAEALRTMGYLPFLPPDVGGFPKGERLLGPHSLVHTFDLLHAVSVPRTTREPVDDLFARFGVFDVSDRSREVVADQRDPATRAALVATSPEFSLV